MCGIAGIFNYKSKANISYSVLTRMCEIIKHRGPDDEGIYINNEHCIGLGQRRLSIIDINTGHQPMSSNNGDVWISFNGEIYNFEELKKDLIKKGYKFRTTSDTEVIINLYLEYAEKSFEKLNGIFAIALYDMRIRTLFLIRDRFGVKPLYYYLSKDGIIFGSEIKTILVNPNYNKDINYEAIGSFLTFRYNPSPQTLFKGIEKLNPGYSLKVQLNVDHRIINYCISKPKTDNSITEDDAISSYQTLLEKAIRRQMISDVPIGLLLSGGIDSAIIGKIMSNESSNQVNTYSIGFEGVGDFNELTDAQKTAKLIGARHNILTIDKNEYLEFFYKSFYYIEEPISETTIPALYYVCKLAQQDVKVVLAGQGADEPLAGYKRYIGEKYINKHHKLIRSISSFFSLNSNIRNERIKRTIYASNFSDELQRFLAIYTIFTPLEKSNLILDYNIEKYESNNIKLIQNLYNQTSNYSDTLNKLTFIDTRLNLSDDLLLFGDKVSMANSIEMRVPFLDNDLVSFLETLPSTLKIRGFEQKYIHKKALIKWLPREIINRKKRGFSTPMDAWLRNDLSTVIDKIIFDKNSFLLSLFKRDALIKYVDDHRRKKSNNMRKLFCLISLEIWYQNFYNNRNLKHDYNYYNN